MLRTFVGTVVILFAATVCISAEEKNKDKKDNKGGNKCKATITKVDSKAGTITLRMKDKEGKEMERTFRLTEDVRMLDESTGKVVAIDVFQSGNEILVIEAEGKLKELHKNPKAATGKEPGKEKGKETSKEKKPEGK
jgi:Cu/Ag efflux protein CusF